MANELTNTDYFTQLAVQRAPTLVKSLFIESDVFNPDTDWNFILGSSDQGVQYNRGRQGAKDAGRVILNHLANMIKPISHARKLCPHVVKQEISQNLWSPHLVHLGSGHDHVYELLKLALGKGIKKFLIFNLDAHADMRPDDLLHSGTPFRYFFTKHQKDIKNYHLAQWGIHRYYQSESDLDLKGAEVEVLWSHEIDTQSIEQSIKKIKLLVEPYQKNETLVLVSLDADVLCGSNMPAVSAVNPRGFSVDFTSQIIKKIQQEFQCFQTVLGVYEYNPLYDDISARGAKTLATIVYDWCLGRDMGVPFI